MVRRVIQIICLPEIDEVQLADEIRGRTGYADVSGLDIVMRHPSRMHLAQNTQLRWKPLTVSALSEHLFRHALVGVRVWHGKRQSEKVSRDPFTCSKLAINTSSGKRRFRPRAVEEVGRQLPAVWPFLLLLRWRLPYNTSSSHSAWALEMPLPPYRN